VWKNHRVETLHGYLLANQSARWYTVLVSIMATQASAITFLSTPGQAYADGMRFVQFYFGLPFAMIVLAVTAVPLYHRLRVFTAYEFLEKRFDLKTRTFATLLFLVSRGLSTGISIYATSLVLSVLLGWSLPLTNLVIGGLVVAYTTSGGSNAVNWTQSWQFLIAIGGMVVALVVIVRSLPEAVSLAGATRVADQLGRLNVVDFRFDLTKRYNFWSGLVGGFFLSLAYFGTDQSQVGRYLGGRSVEASRLGLLINGLLKVPMQFFILFVGAMVFVFYQFVAPPVLFNPAPLARLRSGPYAGELLGIEARHRAAFEARRAAAEAFVLTGKENESASAAAGEALRAADGSYAAVRAEAVALVKAHDLPADANDTNYVFLSFVLAHLPTGLVGLILAVVFAASMSSNSAALNSLASTSVVDVYVRLVKKNREDSHYLAVSRIATALWGAFSIAVSMYANRVGTLIEAVNILGSLFYGTMLGIFLVAFYLPKVRGTPVFAGGIAGLASVWACFAFTRLSYLWFNVVGCVVVIGVALALSSSISSTPRSSSPRPR